MKNNYIQDSKYENVFLFLSFFLFVYLSITPLQAQVKKDNQISLDVRREAVDKVFARINSQTNLKFFYDQTIVDQSAPVTLRLRDVSIEKILDEITRQTNLIFNREGNTILVSSVKRNEANASIEKPRSLTGSVYDSYGQPIIGANVVEKGTSNGTITDLNGNFSLVIAAHSSVEISYIGYVTQVIVPKGNTLVVNLKEDSQALEEVVVVGYGTQKKVTLTGAVSAIDNEQIMTTKNDNVQNMLAGKIPGVRVAQKTGEPGTHSSSFEIRGMGNPLIIIDGVPRENMDRLDPNEVESISVLKDASAAIYGVRAANGVVLITTKKGKSDLFELNYNGYVGWQQATGLPETCDALEFMTLSNENSINNGNGLVYNEADMKPYRDGTKQSTDWAGAAIKNTAPITQHSFSANGNIKDKVNYYVNFGYLNNQGFWKSGDLSYERFNIRSNVSAQITKRLKAEVLLGAYMDTKNQPYHDVWQVYKSVWTQVPVWPLYANDNPNYLYNAADGSHPLVITNSDLDGYRKYNNKVVQTTFRLEYDIPFITGLKAGAMYSYDYNMYDDKEFAKEYSLYTYDSESDAYLQAKGNSPSNLTRSFHSYQSTAMQLSLSYNNTFADKHHVSAMAIYEENTSEKDNFYAKRELSMDAVDQLFAGNSANQEGSMVNTGYSDDNAKHLDAKGIWKIANKGWIGRVNYDFSSKYMAEFSFRMDGSSLFGKGHRWGFFPAGSVGWRLSEESFIKETEALSFVNNLKIRASYGKMGDDGSSSYQFLSGYNYPSNGYVFGGKYVNALNMRGMANPMITWITAKMLNVGIDGDLWNGLLGFQFDVFRRERDGLLSTRVLSLPGTVGAELPQENLNGDLTRGYEILLSHRNKIHDFTYYFTGNVSYARTRNTYVEISERGNSYRNWRDNLNDRFNDLWWGYGYIGQYTSYDQVYNSAIIDAKGNSKLRPGDYMYEDWNGDGVIDEYDQHPIATTGLSKINFGFSLGGEWKGFDLNLVFQGAAKVNVKYPEQLQQPLCWNRNGLDMFMDRWHQVDMTDPDSEWIPGYYCSTNVGETYNYVNSGRSVQNASYLRLKSVEFGYSIPASVLNTVGIKKARLYFNGYNLLTFTGLKYLDPEHTDDTYGYLYPLVKSFNIGVNVTF